MAKKKGAGASSNDTDMPDELVAMLAEAARQRERYEAYHPAPLPVADLIDTPHDEYQLSAEEILDECSQEPETDIGNARRLLLRYGERIIYVSQLGWHVRDGARYKHDEDGAEVRKLAQKTAEAIDDEAIKLDAKPEEQQAIASGKAAAERLKDMGKPLDKWTAEQLEEFHKCQDAVAAMRSANKARDGRRSSRHSHAKSSAGTSKLNNMLTEAAPHCGKSVDDLNVDLHAINVTNGTLRFRRSESGNWELRLDPHRPGDLITKLAPVAFDPKAKAVTFDRFIEEVMPDEEIRRFLQRYMGYCLLGLTIEHCLLFFHGSGRNGKSTFAELFTDLLGDYAASMSIDSFSGDQQRKGSDATPDLARLPGVRLVTAEEPEMGVKLKSALIKKMTGGTRMDVRRLNADFFEFSPHFKIILSGNHKPIITDDSDGMWARVHMVPWHVQIPKERIDRELPQRLRRELPGVFAWAVRGALQYLNEGLRPPGQVIEATEEYRQESDPLGSFVKGACLVTGDDADTITPVELHEAYLVHAKQNGLPEFQAPTFTRRFPDQARKDWPHPDGGTKQFRKHRTDGRTIWRGIRLLRPPAPPSEYPAGRFSDEPFPDEF